MYMYFSRGQHINKIYILSIDRKGFQTRNSLCSPVFPNCFQDPGLRPIRDDDTVVIRPHPALHTCPTLAILGKKGGNHVKTFPGSGAPF